VYLGKTVKDLIASSELPETWEQVDSKDPDIVVIEQQKGADYSHRPLDCIQELFAALRPALWSVVTSDYPHRKYYFNFDSSLGPRRLPQWASMYVLFFYLSDLTRYRPVHFDRFLESKYGPQIESILDECPRQFLYLAASELLKREVAPAALALDSGRSLTWNPTGFNASGTWFRQKDLSFVNGAVVLDFAMRGSVRNVGCRLKRRQTPRHLMESALLAKQF
jgi:hypothetical protein